MTQKKTTLESNGNQLSVGVHSVVIYNSADHKITIVQILTEEQPVIIVNSETKQQNVVVFISDKSPVYWLPCQEFSLDLDRMKDNFGKWKI